MAEGQAILPQEWGQIYASIWLDMRTGRGEYLEKFQSDPAAAVKEIAAKLGIKYNEHLFVIKVGVDDSNDPSDLTNDQLKLIIANNTTHPLYPAFELILKMCC